MIAHEISNETGVLPNVTLFKCTDEDIELHGNHIYLKVTPDEDDVEFSITSTKDLLTNLTKIGKRIEQDSYAKRVILDIEIFIYQYKNKFAIQYNTTSRIENLAKSTVDVIEQLIEDYDERN